MRDIDLTVAPGETVGVAGPNGSGKTTLLRLLATLHQPDTGSGHVLGARLGSRDVYDVRRHVGLMSHVPALIPELTLRENLEHVLALAQLDPGRGQEALRVVGLEAAAGRRAAESSFGMKRRAEVARLLITKPDILLLDEAYSGLDEDAQGLIGALIDRTRHRSGTAILVSHDAAHLRSLVDRVYGLSTGRLVTP